MTPLERFLACLPDARRTGAGLVRCPAHHDSDPSLAVDEGADGRLLLFDHGYCSVDQVLAAVGWTRRDLFFANDRTPRRRARTNATEKVVTILAECTADNGRVAEYLKHRGLSGVVPAALRYAQQLDYYDDKKLIGTFPAIVAPVVGGAAPALHRTYLASDGPGKAPVPAPKKSLGRVKGGAIHLAASGSTLALGEGIETALAVMEATGTPSWSTISAANMPHVVLPKIATTVELWADPGGAGERAAEETARIHHAAGRTVFVIVAPEGKDWLDVLVAEGPEALRRARAEATQWAPRGREPRREREPGKDDDRHGHDDDRRDHCREPVGGDTGQRGSSGGRGGGGGGPSQATKIVDLALAAKPELFHTPEGDCFAAVCQRGHTETWALRSRGFKLWLVSLYHATTRKAPSPEALGAATNTLEAEALFKGKSETVFTRLAEYDGDIYFDLADDAWRVAKITGDGWEVLDGTAPVHFRRPKGMLPLPLPERGGTLQALRDLINVDDDAWTLVVGWLIGTLRPGRSFPVLAVHGEQGSGKTTQTKMLRGLVDPNVADLRAFPKDEGDLILAATNGWIVGFENVSYLPDWLSDALCRLSTGAGFGKRQLYTDAEETLFAAKRPVMLNGITEVAVRGDLSSRAITVVLATLAAYREEDELWAVYHAARPRLLGALLDVVAGALRALPAAPCVQTVRMADFARWACAAEGPLGWEQGRFLAAYRGNRDDATALTLEASPVATALRAFVAICPVPDAAGWYFTGSAAELLKKLENYVSDQTTKAKRWPRNARALSSALRRLAPELRHVGIDADFDRRRVITIKPVPAPAPPPGGSGAAGANAKGGRSASANAGADNSNDSGNIGAKAQKAQNPPYLWEPLNATANGTRPCTRCGGPTTDIDWGTGGATCGGCKANL